MSLHVRFSQAKDVNSAKVNRMKQLNKSPALLFAIGLILSACANGKSAKSSMERVEDPVVRAEDLSTLVEGNTDLAFDLYQAIGVTSGNQVYSPYSISLAFAMAYGGADGATAEQMAHVLHFPQPEDQFHPVFNALDWALSNRPDQATGVDEHDRFELTIANAIWGQADWPFLPGYLDLLAVNYGAGMRLVDFEKSPEGARRQINKWVSDQTNKQIKDIIPPGSLDSTTRLVLSNAIYFKAFWEHEFDAKLTSDRPFSLLDEQMTRVPMMTQGTQQSLFYADGNGWQAVALPYKGKLTEMVILVPDPGNFEAFEDNLTSEKYSEIISGMEKQGVILSMPSFKFDASYNLSDILIQLGMANAFDHNLADFSRMDNQRMLYISDALHKAFIAVDEKGTEAAAATVISMEMTSMRPEGIILNIDRPFIFTIRDVPTGTILFMGRVVDPR